MSFASAAPSCSRTSAAFSHFSFLRKSVASSLSLRTSTWGFLAMDEVFLSLLPGRCLVCRAAGEADAALGIGGGEQTPRGFERGIGGGAGPRADRAVVA